MRENLAQSLTEITAFTNEHRIDAEFHLHRVNELRDGSETQNLCWARFEKRSGVYCILSADGSKTKYVGMSKVDTGSRVFPWVFPKPAPDGATNSKTDDDDVVLSVVLEKQSYMAPALESYLITRLKPEFNKKR